MLVLVSAVREFEPACIRQVFIERVCSVYSPGIPVSMCQCAIKCAHTQAWPETHKYTQTHIHTHTHTHRVGGLVCARVPLPFHFLCNTCRRLDTSRRLKCSSGTDCDSFPPSPCSTTRPALPVHHIVCRCRQTRGSSRVPESTQCCQSCARPDASRSGPQRAPAKCPLPQTARSAQHKHKQAHCQ